MNRLLALAVTVFAALALAHADFADAARLGGGRSFGTQRQHHATRGAHAHLRPATRSPALPPIPSCLRSRAPRPQHPRPQQRAAAAAAPSRASRWLGPIAGHRRGPGPRRAVVASRPVGRAWQPAADRPFGCRSDLPRARIPCPSRWCCDAACGRARRTGPIRTRTHAGHRACVGRASRARSDRRGRGSLPAGIRRRTFRRSGTAAVPPTAGRVRPWRSRLPRRHDHARDARGDRARPGHAWIVAVRPTS